jgi:hypothetical protein
MAANNIHSRGSLVSGHSVIEARAHASPDGVLNLSIPIGVADVDVTVILQVKPLRVAAGVDENGWPRGYFDEVPGSMLELQRAPGASEVCLPIE